MIFLCTFILFLAFLGLLGTYLLYPLVITAVAAWKRWRADDPPEFSEPDEKDWPTVSFIIAAFNEDASIRAKIENTLAINYPSKLLEVIVASDGSTDGTNILVSTHTDPRVRLVGNPENRGKTATTNLAVEEARGEVVVFSDATGMYNEDSLKHLIGNLMADDSLGAVAGRVTYSYQNSATAKGFRLYQRWVVAQRNADHIVHTETSVSGSIHALWRKLWKPAPDHLSYDMVVPAMMALQGKRTGYAPDATSAEVSRNTAAEEFKARTRIAIRAFGFLAWLGQQPRRAEASSYLLQLFYQKILRWVTPVLLITALLAHEVVALQEGGLALTLLIIHATLHIAGLSLVLLDHLKIKVPGTGPILLFYTTVLAFLLGFFRFLRGHQMAKWTPDRSAEEAARGVGS
jgi:cellulose synthase/poly-beta-1,6-N-acetylglucosamine synthase-like glycosyltransferase